MKKLLVGAGALVAALGIGNTTTSNTNNNSSQQVAQTPPVKTNADSTNTQTQPTIPFVNYRREKDSDFLFCDPGIPPKVYGMHYVKRGTHKRTNKK